MPKRHTAMPRLVALVAAVAFFAEPTTPYWITQLPLDPERQTTTNDEGGER
jgi:hypothetical protein